MALRYKVSDDPAPRVVARGYGAIAERIIEEAKSHDVFVHDSPELVALLMQIDLDEYIPPHMYTAIAELLVWLSAVDKKVADER
ncbi:EscU/YscU/HrcU family type III secretion system export apparatus switch protein [Halioglobus japonicus]|uniref:EscU/YscU/HrcU family type III secretion system export apparatus switch protein n=1 Tax=Halioglobus japonicus TaxID=930805 RepID=UPI0023E4788F|nr:EscU/YscU/HrcU family type III secretion system export apparatus switch protein [Halioglobus japonicus]